MAQRNCRLTFRNDRADVTYFDPRIDEDISARSPVSSLRLDTIRLLSSIVEQGGSGCTADTIKVLGRCLYEIAFPEGTVDDAFSTTVAQAVAKRQQDPDYRLTLTLEFKPEVVELAELPWEYLYLDHAERPGYLSGQLDALLFARVVRLGGEQQLLVGDLGPLPEAPRVLLITAKPDGTPDIDTASLHTFLTALHNDHAIVLDEMDDPTYRELLKYFQERSGSDQPPWDILHLVCHGEPGRLLFRRDPAALDADRTQAERDRFNGIMREPSRFEEVTTGQIRQLVELVRPRVALLQACHSAAGPSAHGALFSVAKELVSTDVPAVVAMQYSIEGARASLFATTFYEKITAGGTVGLAVHAGRRTLANREGAVWATRDFGIPVVYLRRQDDFALVSRPQPITGHGATGSTQKSSPPPEQLTRTCPRCRTEVQYSSCARCRWRLICPTCQRVTQYFADFDYATQMCFCGGCESEFAQPVWSGRIARPGGQPNIAVASMPGAGSPTSGSPTSGTLRSATGATGVVAGPVHALPPPQAPIDEAVRPVPPTDGVYRRPPPGRP